MEILTCGTQKSGYAHPGKNHCVKSCIHREPGLEVEFDWMWPMWGFSTFNLPHSFPHLIFPHLWHKTERSSWNRDIWGRNSEAGQALNPNGKDILSFWVFCPWILLLTRVLHSSRHALCWNTYPEVFFPNILFMFPLVGWVTCLSLQNYL